MPRFLTPEHICLLLLIKFYTHEAVEKRPHSLQLLELISQHVLMWPDQDSAPISQHETLSMASLSAKLSQWESGHPGMTTWQCFTKVLWKIINGVDSLHDAITELRYASVPEAPASPSPLLITPASPLGQFIRRCYVEFTRLQFHDSESLWQAFAAYREPSRSGWKSRFPDDAERAAEVAIANSIGISQLRIGSGTARELASPSAVDADALLGHAINSLQKLGTRVPTEIKSKLESWIGDQRESSTQSLHFFMAFFEHWRAGQYTMALESLHRYFDYSLASRNGSDNMKIYYQYALLHLSVLHADFECWEESIDAMNECIATARENHDTACLNFALSWLLYLRHANPSRVGESYSAITGASGIGGSGSRDEIDFLKTKAREGKFWMLLGSTLLEEAKDELYSGGNVNRAHEHVLQALYLSTQHDVRTMIPPTMLFYGSCLDRLGQAHLSMRVYDLSEAVHSKHCPLTDRIRSKCRIALTQAHHGHITRALALLEEVRPLTKGVLKSEQRIKAVSVLIQWRRAIHRGKAEASKYYLSQLRSLRNTSADAEILYELDILEIETLLSTNSFLEAHQKVSTKLSQLKTAHSSDIAQRLQFLILKARIFAASGKAPKGFSLALRATATAERHFIIPIMLEGLAVLSKILISLSEFAAARDVLSSALPHALEISNIHLVARMYMSLGEAHVGFAGFGCAEGSKEREKSMRLAGEVLEVARGMFERCEEREGSLGCLIMLERVKGWCGDVVGMRRAGEMYVEVFERETI